MKKRIELLAPAGSSDALHAAVENGADAVYLGGKLFSARQQADNFDMEVLKEELEYAHARGVSIYLTMNTLVSDDEMKQALIFAVEARRAGIDGIIVQDLGLAGALRRVIPDVPLHGSTQMTIYDMDGVRALESMGFKRVVLARELTLKEASEIANNTRLEVEVFIHGALCVCYSGQCLMSSMIGGRSGNRGRCAQPCRLPYRLIGNTCSDQKTQYLPEAAHSGHHAQYRSDVPKPQYLLSPKDICSLEYMPEIVCSGIRSLKIEGRMKSPEYVATVVRIYRKYLDLALKQVDACYKDKLQIADADMHDLLQIFNRGGFSSGYMNSKSGIDMMCFEKPNNSGIYLGKVKAYDEKSQTVSIKLEDKLSVGDGVEIWTGGLNSPGGIVTSITDISKGDIPQHKRNTSCLREECPLSFKGDIPKLQRTETREWRQDQGLKTAMKGGLVAIGRFRGEIIPGMGIYKTLDTELNKAARESFTGKSVKRVAVRGQAVLKSGRSLMLKVEDYDGHITSAVGTVLPEAALNRPLTEERLRDQLSKTGSTPFIFDELQMVLENGLSITVSEINEVRRQALDSLLRTRADRYTGLRSDDGIGARIEEVLQWPNAIASDGRRDTAISFVGSTTPAISLYFYKWDQNMDYAGLGADRLYLPLTAMDKPGFRDTASTLGKAGIDVFGWLPSVAKGNCESLIERFIDQYGEYEIDGILAGNIGTVQKLKEVRESILDADCGEGTQINSLRLAGDISMNLFNTLSIQEAAKMGLESVALSIEMTLQQIAGLTNMNALPIIETAVYGRLPLMISEYCPVGCVEGGFKASSRCSGCCGRGDYKLQDRLEAEFPVLCNRFDCRSIILNSKALFVPDSLKSLRAAGVGIFRLYIWDEPPDIIKGLIQLHKERGRSCKVHCRGTSPNEKAASFDNSKQVSAYSGLAERIKTAGFTKGHFYRGV